MPRAARVALTAAFGACVAGIGAVGFWPTPVDAPVDRMLARILSRLHTLGMPAYLDYETVQFSANILFFMPIGALIAAAAPRTYWWTGALFGLALSLMVEFGQYVLLPHRFASAGDLLSNTIGALLGSLIVAAVRRGNARRDARRVAA